MIILASKSPRRQELMKYITNDFVVKATDVDETLPNDITPDEAVKYLSRIKAEPLKNRDDIIIGADTVVAYDGIILGKPKSEQDAYDMLKCYPEKSIWCTQELVLSPIIIVSHFVKEQR